MSGFLVDQLDATAEKGSLTKALAAVYCHLAQTWISPLPAARETPVKWQDFAKRIQELNKPFDVKPAPHVPGGKWPAIEVLNALNHVEVLLRAAIVLENAKWVLKRCAPTQQYLAEGELAVPPAKLADLEGKDDKGEAFALEAYGGVDYRNNSKLALDLNALRQCKKPRLLLAARKKAWPSNLQTLVNASCEKRNGGPFKIEATLAKRWEEDDQVSVIEMTAITRDTTRPKDFS